MTTAILPSRDDSVAQLRARPHSDVLIIGGGINGLSTLRELAHAGIDAILVERNDYSSGASAGSSHMIHGGIRYLENGELRLVRESLQERNRLLDNAPHYVSPLATTIPIFSTFSGLLTAPLRLLTHRSISTRERGALLIKLGLVLYDTFGRKAGTLPRHRFWGRRTTLAAYPAMNPNVRYTAHYSDACVTSPERLALDVLREAHGASSTIRTANYVEVIGAQGGAITLRDTLSGETWSHHASVVVNASGPWTDLTNTALGLATSYLGGTKGSHIVVDSPDLVDACRDSEVFFENNDGRIVLIFPLLDKVLIGTTDIPVDSPDDVRCTDEEVDYFFALVRHVFPGITLTHDQIVYRYSGVRPLPATGDVNPGVVSRDYRIVHDTVDQDTALLSLVGGKWTTFRALGEHVARETLALLGATSNYSSVDDPIGGGHGFPRQPEARMAWIESHRGRVSPQRADILLTRYGTIAGALMSHLSATGDTPLSSLRDYSVEEIQWLVRHETVAALADLSHRRTSMGFEGLATTKALNELADIAGGVLGWSQAEKKRQVQDVTRWASG